MKLFLIFLAVIFCLSACINFDFNLPDIDFGGLNGGSVVFPPSEDPDVPSEPSEDQPVGFDLKNWHNGDWCGGNDTIVTPCGTCGETYSVNDIDNSNQYAFYESAFGTYTEYACPSCILDGMIAVCTIHCYQNGVCHLCDFVCPCTCSNINNETGCITCLPPDHPVRVSYMASYKYPYFVNDWFDNDYDSHCDICGMYTGANYD